MRSSRCDKPATTPLGAVTGFVKDPSPFSDGCDTDAVGFKEYEVMGGVGESALVSGVSVWLRFLEAARPFCRADELKTEDAVLA